MLRSMRFSKKIIINYIFLLFILMILLGSLIYYYGSVIIKNNIKEVLPTYAEQSAQIISTKVNLHKAQIESIANRTRLRNMDWSDQKLVLREEVERTGYINMGISDTLGITRYYNGKEISSKDRLYFRKALKGETYISDIINCALTNDPIIAISAPIFDHESNLVAVLITRLETTLLTDVTDNLKYGKRGYSYIINNHGTVLSHKIRELFMEQRNFIEEADFNPEFELLARFLERMISGEKGFGFYPFMGSIRYMGFSPIEGTGWSIAVGSYKSEVLKPIYQLLGIIGLSFFIIAIIGTILSTLLGNSLSKQTNVIINQTKSLVENLIKGDFNTKIVIGNPSPDFKEFIYSINYLIDRFEASYKKLEYTSEFDKLVSKISNNFINVSSEEIDKQFINSLKIITDFFCISRTYLVFFQCESFDRKCYYEYFNNSSEYLSEYFLKKDFRNYSFIKNSIESKNIFTISSEPGSEIEDSQILSEMQKLKLRYSIFVPLVFHNNLKGYLLLQKNDLSDSKISDAINNKNYLKNWQENDFELLRVLSEIMTNAKIRSEIENKLRESERKIATLIENLPGTVFRCKNDEKFSMIYLSTGIKNLTGYSVNDFLSYKIAFRDIIHRNDYITLKNQIEENKLSSKPYESTYRIRTLEGKEKWLWEKGIVINDGDIETIEGFITDITVQKQATDSVKKLNTDLKNINHELEQIVYVTSHDLRSPLLNIEGFSKELISSLDKITDIIYKNYSPEEKLFIMNESDFNNIKQIISNDINESFEYIQTSIKKMDSLLKSLLFLSRHGKHIIQPGFISMNNLIGDVIKNFDFQLSSGGIAVNIDNLPDCFADEFLINRIFTNLIENAIKYLDPARRGVIEVSGYKDNESSVYTVKDNGVGIKSENLEHIFQLFYRVNKSISSGEGLGLTIVKKNIQRLNGKVWVKSDFGKGTCVYISIPANNTFLYETFS